MSNSKILDYEERKKIIFDYYYQIVDEAKELGEKCNKIYQENIDNLSFPERKFLEGERDRTIARINHCTQWLLSTKIKKKGPLLMSASAQSENNHLSTSFESENFEKIFSSIKEETKTNINKCDEYISDFSSLCKKLTSTSEIERVSNNSLINTERTNSESQVSINNKKDNNKPLEGLKTKEDLVKTLELYKIHIEDRIAKQYAILNNRLDKNDCNNVHEYNFKSMQLGLLLSSTLEKLDTEINKFKNAPDEIFAKNAENLYIDTVFDIDNYLEKRMVDVRKTTGLRFTSRKPNGIGDSSYEKNNLDDSIVSSHSSNPKQPNDCNIIWKM